MKRILLFISLGILLCILMIAPKVYRTLKNVQNSKEIKLGMEKEEVLNIMGEPDSRRISYFDEFDSLYFYQPPFGASSGIEIIFGSDKKVNKVLYYE
jgi:outer membrane protein assembly factor BamE (lipoprotein component of BamABCDE complex)